MGSNKQRKRGNAERAIFILKFLQKIEKYYQKGKNISKRYLQTLFFML
jgi:uncharacterized protein YktA (UPF0223 family)